LLPNGVAIALAHSARSGTAKVGAVIRFGEALIHRLYTLATVFLWPGHTEVAGTPYLVLPLAEKIELLVIADFHERLWKRKTGIFRPVAGKAIGNLTTELIQLFRGGIHGDWLSFAVELLPAVPAVSGVGSEKLRAFRHPLKVRVGLWLVTLNPIECRADTDTATLQCETICGTAG
jgi:hypothetical protein